jgi:hypothetical protein
VGAGRNPAALGLLFTWTRGTILMGSTPHPLLANEDDVYICNTKRRKTQLEEKEVAIMAVLATERCD